MPNADSHGKIADIELLRGVAIIFVLIEHTRINLFPWIHGVETRLYFYFGFWTGVDLFFAISGFVIARSLLPTLAAAGGGAAGFFNAALAFWIRRAWRLLPSAWLWLAVILVLAAVFNRSHVFWSFRSNFEGAVAAALDVANFRIWIVYRKFDPGSAFPYWSLSLEEQFYILLPIAVFVARKFLPYVLGAAIALQFFTVRIGPGTTDFGLLLNMLRSDALMFGVLIAMWSRHPTYRLFEPVGLRRRGAGLAVFFLFVFCLAAMGAPGLNLVSFQVGMVALISAILVFFASYDRDYLFPAGPVKQVMLWFGSRSYALYLIHIPAFFATRELWFRIEPEGTIFNGTFTLRFALTAGLLLLAFTELNYRFIEVPLRRRGARIAQRIAERPV